MKQNGKNKIIKKNIKIIMFRLKTCNRKKGKMKNRINGKIKRPKN